MLIDLERNDLGRISKTGSVKVDEFMVAQTQNLDHGDTADMRGQCRINCGAEVVILNVLPFLIAN